MPQPNNNASMSGPDMIKVLKQLQSNFETRIEVFDHQTVVLRVRYNLLIDRGFTDAQALYLCTQDWTNAL